MASKRKGKVRRPRCILIVGDWVLDEHWVSGVHRSSISSRTGKAHYRALQSQNSAVYSLCGAGQVASILQSACGDGDASYELVGLGIWDKQDTETLRCMVDPNASIGKTPHRLVFPRMSADKAAPRLFNLADFLGDSKGLGAGTSRYIRVYQHTGERVHLIQRIDWEVPLPEGRSAWILNESDVQTSRLEKRLSEFDVDSVVVKDLCKGVVSSALIRWLAEQFSGCDWFVSTKAWRPTWFKELEKVNLKLLLIPQVAAQSAVREGAVTSWLSGSGHGSEAAIRELDALAAKFGVQPLIVALPEGETLIARVPGQGDQRVRGLIQPEVESRTQSGSFAVGVPMASVFFPGLVSILTSGSPPDKTAVSRALAFTRRWRSFEGERVANYEGWNPKNSPRLADEQAVPGELHEFDWARALEDWSGAFDPNRNGTISKEGSKRIELWRAMTEVGGYVCCMESKRTALRKLVREFRGFDGTTTKSAMLIAKPGSGKSYLVRCLSKHLGFRLLAFNITQMLSKMDILDCFDTIVTTHAQNKDEKLLVFFDEINALLESQHVYDSFLAPLEEGIYVRAGKTFPIGACAWIFAGTEALQVTDPGRDRSTKASDFVSRLTLKALDLTVDPAQHAQVSEARLEKVYLGVSLLRAFYPDVRRVSSNVLNLFHILSPNVEAREVTNLVKSFADIQYGQVTSRNVPESWLNEHRDAGVDYTPWVAAEQGDMVEIVG